MLFNTIEFAIFLPCVFLCFFLLRAEKRVLFLLLASYYFYVFWRWEYILLILAQTELNFLAALGMERSKTLSGRRAYLAFALVTTLAILFFFKYWNFGASTANSLLHAVGFTWQAPRFGFLLPVGISFHTFQTLGYTIDVYRSKLAVERNFARFALFVSFFPLLVAGPIERGGNLLSQFKAEQHITYDNWAAGLRLILWGLIKKMVIADRVGTAVGTVYADPQSFPGPLLLLATFFFAVQIYCDFSGYSDIAIGVARLMGYKLMTNFRMPYFATSLSEFWQRWHIALSTWFRDYVYFPLGGNRVSRPRWVFNIFLVFVLSGLWHGANWTFAIWGAIHGSWLVLEKLMSKPASAVVQWLGLKPDAGFLTVARWALVFSIVLCSWVFFKASSLHQAAHIFKGFLNWHTPTLPQTLAMGLPAFELGLSLVSIAVLFCVDAAWFWEPAFVKGLWAKRPMRWSLYLGGAYALVFFGVLGRVEFIYFQF